jgi:two-component system chemotaxis response regulator CheB
MDELTLLMNAVGRGQSGREILRVFIVDDSATFRRLIRATLESSPFIEVVGIAASAEEALGAISEILPHVVIVDLTMPGLGGLQLLRLLRQSLQVPAVIVSANSDPSVIQQACEIGQCAFVAKPNSPLQQSFRLELISAVKEAVSRSRSVALD